MSDLGRSSYNFRSLYLYVDGNGEDDELEITEKVGSCLANIGLFGVTATGLKQCKRLSSFAAKDLNINWSDFKHLTTLKDLHLFNCSSDDSKPFLDQVSAKNRLETVECHNGKNMVTNVTISL